jgi:GNAT superfamily N-acetyltransferase
VSDSGANHPLSAVLEDAAQGRYPEPDGVVDVLPPLPGAADAMIGFTGHFVLAAGIAAAEVAARVPNGDLSVPMSSAFLTWVGAQIGSRPGTFDALLCASGRGAGEPDWLVRETDATHPRIARARRYRHHVDVWRTHDRAGVLIVGRGVCDRWEIAFEVAPEARGCGLGRRLVEAARSLAPKATTLWAQVAPGNAASLRAVIAGGFRPVGAEVLFPRAG